ncbi:hypothetical protein GALMADRAFT_1132375 [Galerina marginata CBS 339.88]|uniref:Uncharacterized protein n=1 Tax=Galerina marginata (strain CBS 339.88) TaxID=685588 RepID=A0A067SAM7_GALM3|nr:hypothetical protein GALMADRAFT_1132375 [Galerina marginata CBS 339.88]
MLLIGEKRRNHGKEHSDGIRCRDTDANSSIPSPPSPSTARLAVPLNKYGVHRPSDKAPVGSEITRFETAVSALPFSIRSWHGWVGDLGEYHGLRNGCN